MYVLCNVFFVLSTSIANFQIKHLSTLFFITSNYANYELLNSSNRIDLNYRSEYGENLKLDQTNNFTTLKAFKTPWFTRESAENDVSNEIDDKSVAVPAEKYIKNRTLRDAWIAMRNKHTSDQQKRLLSSWVGTTSSTPNGSGRLATDEFESTRAINEIEANSANLEEYYLNREYERHWHFGAEVPDHQIEKLDNSKFKLKTWPQNTYLRIKLLCAYRKYINLAVHRIRNAIQDTKSLKLTSVKTIPKKVNRFLIICSPTIDKRSKDHYEIEQHTRVLDIYPQDGIDTSKIEFSKLLLIPMPVQVKYESWFQEINGPTKSEFIHQQYIKKWISKYYIYNRDKKSKIEIINQLLEPENKEFMPLRWPNTFYSLYKIPLPQLEGMLKRVQKRRDLIRQYDIFNIQRPNIKPLPEVPDSRELKLNVVQIDD
ncbi:apicoplast ribosomal protein S10 precursor, putative [Babesia microti strain RI]|uniref:Apicoplast ribosomal protein S10, putative n=1 Tax=Babesia microti (strain RI) TaxID=1133968 RepID=A0A1N6LXR5_BABMR|nr:apicoplast ribosomal protein S10 precursor, putative [Babesia microti strain RI]SIO73665.1 apicoplast ribosomal protein S10 precursor, putative [Babesia microti strain RI]|eukprot:XP_021337738.1 apicoplast ribosomal protein S10 precursor, putative [Babesia microti strain RI]